jgi:hypothetical protein
MIPPTSKLLIIILKFIKQIIMLVIMTIINMLATFVILATPTVAQVYKNSKELIMEKVELLKNNLLMCANIIYLKLNYELLFFGFQKSEHFIHYSIGVSSILIWVKFGDFIPMQFKKPIVLVALSFLNLAYFYCFFYAILLIILVLKKKIQRPPFVVKDLEVFFNFFFVYMYLQSFKFLVQYFHSYDKVDPTTLLDFYSDNPPSRQENKIGVETFILFLFSLFMTYCYYK